MIRDFSAYKGSTPNPLNLGLVDIFTVNCSWCLVFSDPSKVRNIWREAVVFSFWDPLIRRVVQKPTHHIFAGKNLSMAFVWYLVDGWWVDTVGGSLFRLILCYITRWWFQICFMFIPIWGNDGNDSIWLIFSDGLVQPPTRYLAFRLGIVHRFFLQECWTVKVLNGGNIHELENRFKHPWLHTSYCMLKNLLMFFPQNVGFNTSTKGKTSKNGA